MDFLSKCCSSFRYSTAVKALNLTLILSIVAGCNSFSREESQNNPQLVDVQANNMESLRAQMFGNDVPDHHVKEIRDYVFETYPYLSDDVVILVNSTNPKIVNNKNQMEYAFFWVLGDDSILEVVTTPPPLCEPISCHKGKRLTYP